ncbi:ABC transporter substrate-binding protein [Streptomyces armeniacus]|uniref:ABC transporter substrate-binding protein n=1 Tax=Streptomyces armeniacus TaxID=83291 RepID=UPI001AD7EE41|nr:sugar ABC transporter substrate-binding protein [Streptomyces armeniacus]
MRGRRPRPVRGAVSVWAAVLALCAAAALSGCLAQGAGDRNTLRVWVVEAPTPQISGGYTALADDFERRHPGVRVELTEIPYQLYRDKLMLAVQGGTGPDVMVLDQIWTPEFAAAGLIEALDRDIRAAGMRGGDFFAGAWASNRWRDRSWGVPFNVGVWERMYYNADLFRRAGLDPDRPPRTWKQWLAAAGRVDRLPDASGVGLIGCRDEAASVLTDSLLYSAGGRVVSDGRAVFDSPANRRAFTLYQRLSRHAPSGAASACSDDTLAHFTAGRTGMLLDGGWQQPAIEESARFDWRVTTPPAPEGRAFTGALGGWNMAVGTGARDRELAFGFVRLATTSPTHQTAANDSVPALRAAGEAFVRKNHRHPGELLRMLAEGRPRPVVPVYNAVSRAQQDAVQAILGGADVAGALAEAEKAMQRAIDQE